MQPDSPYFKFVAQLLKLLVDKDGSDLFITVGTTPAVKIHGDITAVGDKAVTREQAEAIVEAMMTDKQLAQFRNTQECNFALSLSGVGRFRVNAFIQRGSPGLVARAITTNIPTPESLGLPKVMLDVVMEKRGLVLLVGGTGKSTSLVAMVGYRNMCTFDQSLCDLVARDLVEPEVALRYADSANELRLMLKGLKRNTLNDIGNGLELMRDAGSERTLF